MQAELQTQLLKEQQAAGVMQRRMLPRSPCSMGGCTLSYEVRPADVLSGDFVDFIELDGQRFAFVVADVAGHGASAALVTVVLKSFVTRLPDMTERGPGGILAALNQELLAVDLERHACVLCGVVDTSEQSLLLASGGAFPQPMLARKNAEGSAETLSIPGKALGLFQGASYAEQRYVIESGDRLVVVTDGVLELLGDEELAVKEARLGRAALAQTPGDFWQQLGINPDAGCCDDITYFLLDCA